MDGKILFPGFTQNKLLLALFVTLLSSSCSGVSIEAARQLSVTARNTVIQAQYAALTSKAEYLRARDSEIFLHGFTGTTESPAYASILKLYDSIHNEISKRAAVFAQLASLYDAFTDLANFDASRQVEAALGNLGGAIEAYAQQLNRSPPKPSDTTAVISKIGGLIAGEIQKARIKEASIQIRVQVASFIDLLRDNLVKEQMVGFRNLLLSDVKAALMLLWEADVYEPKPLLDSFGAPAGLFAHEEAAQIVKTNQQLKRALAEVLQQRMVLQAEQIEKVYDSSLDSLDRIVAEHHKLEAGRPLDLARLRAIIANLNVITNMIAKPK